jgi:hypothetical protein
MGGMMKRLGLIVILALCMSVSLATTQEHHQSVWNSGNDFLPLCGDMTDSPTVPPDFHWGECLGYIRGVDDGVEMAYDIMGQSQPYCIPSEVTSGQMSRVLIKFIKDHPEKAHSKTSVLEIEAFMNAFPCKQPSKKQ